MAVESFCQIVAEYTRILSHVSLQILSAYIGLLLLSNSDIFVNIITTHRLFVVVGHCLLYFVK